MGLLHREPRICIQPYVQIMWWWRLRLGIHSLVGDSSAQVQSSYASYHLARRHQYAHWNWCHSWELLQCSNMVEHTIDCNQWDANILSIATNEMHAIVDGTIAQPRASIVSYGQWSASTARPQARKHLSNLDLVLGHSRRLCQATGCTYGIELDQRFPRHRWWTHWALKNEIS